MSDIDDSTIEVMINSEYDKGTTFDSPIDIGDNIMDVNVIQGRVDIMAEEINDEPRKKRIKASITQRDIEFDWDSEKYFQASWIDFIREKLSDRFNVKWFLDDPSIKKWLIVHPNLEEPLKTTFQCRLCLQEYDRRGRPHQSKPKLAKEERLVLGENRMKNREKLVEHISGRSNIAKGKKDNNKLTCSVHNPPLEKKW